MTGSSPHSGFLSASALPSYTAEPSADEQRIARTSPIQRSLPTGTYEQGNSLFKVVFSNVDVSQELGLPVFGRGDAIRGYVGLKSRADISCLTVRVEGKLRLSLLDTRTSEVTLLDVSHTLWRTDGSSEACAAGVPFDFPLPTQCGQGEQRYPLPPSYNYTDVDTRRLSARCKYTVTIEVEREAQYTSYLCLHFIDSPGRLCVKIIYFPRSCPPRAMLSVPYPTVSPIKSLPEDWRQIISTLPPQPPSTLAPIQCQLFIPAVETFAMTTPIAFYFQLRAPSDSLQAFFRVSLPTLSNNVVEAAIPPSMRVYLKRQVVADSRGYKLAHSYSIGGGVLRDLPPRAPGSASVLLPSGEGEDVLDYEGEIKFSPEVTVGGFSSEQISITDFLVISLVPQRPVTAEIQPFYLSHPVKIVTDPYADVSTS
ncbi:hypothetical protein OF83DRAFT_1063871 [Amylostereum chailletii]|nr:hypothetical protein OF83DRAFT_1063871 [Amylostereum chailletii]